MTERVPQAAEPKPDDAAAILAAMRRDFEAALRCQNAGDVEGAIDRYSRLLVRHPNLSDALNNLAVMLKAAKRLPTAVACLRRAIAISPNMGSLHSNLGNILWMMQEFGEAMVALRRAIELDPSRPEPHHNMGLLHFSLGDHQAAIESYDRSLALNPDQAVVRWDRALALLASGDYERGFVAYDVRFDLADPELGFARTAEAIRAIGLPLWRGEDVAGRTLYVYAEQGLGDTIQFVRFLPLVTQRGARVIFDCQAELLRLLATLPGIAELRALGSPVPRADYHLPLLSLPSRLGVTLGNLPASVPYLAPGDAAGGPRLSRSRGARMLVGIAWAGRPDHTNDHNRSLALESLFPLCDIPGTIFCSLQVGPHADDIVAMKAQSLMYDLSGDIRDFADTARAVAKLDLVVTIDSAVAHLAGALGRPCFVLLPFTADWRWLARREDSPWYPSLRLFRQPKPGDWRDVIGRVRDAIAALAPR